MSNNNELSYWLPAVHFHERHDATMSTASPAHIIAALKSFNIQQDPVVRTLMSLRQLPQRLLTKSPPDFTLSRFTELETTADSSTQGLIGRFWQPDMGLESIADVQAWQNFHASDCARLILKNRVIARPEGNYQVITETFIYCPTQRIYRKMQLYWLFIRIASGWIRKRTLKQVARSLHNN